MAVNLNGDMSQWTLGAAAMPDCWRIHNTSAAAFTIGRSTDVPSRVLCGGVIPYSTEITVATADASLAAADLTVATYRGEGSELCSLAGGIIPIRLWLKGLPGTYNLHFSNGAETLSYSQPLVLVAADMWTRFSVWVPEIPDPDGSWYYDWRVGYTIGLTLCVGSGGQSEMEKWTSGLKFGGAQINFNSTVGNKLKIAGLTVGRHDGFAMAELTEQACMRYLQKSFDRAQAPVQALGLNTGELSTAAYVGGVAGITLPSVRLLPMRKTPAMTGYNPAASNSQARATSAGDCTGTTFDRLTPYGFRCYTVSPAGTAAGEIIGVHWLADASLPALTQSVGG